MANYYLQTDSLPLSSNCFLCHAHVPGDTKDLFEHFRTVHFNNSNNSNPNSFTLNQNGSQLQFQHYEAISSDSETNSSTSGESLQDGDVLKWTTEEVSLKLQMEGFSSLVIDTLKEEDIDGQSLLLLTKDDFTELKLKMGPRKKMELLIQTLKAASASVPQPSVPRFISLLPSFTQVVQPPLSVVAETPQLPHFTPVSTNVTIPVSTLVSTSVTIPASTSVSTIVSSPITIVSTTEPSPVSSFVSTPDSIPAAVVSSPSSNQDSTPCPISNYTPGSTPDYSSGSITDSDPLSIPPKPKPKTPQKTVFDVREMVLASEKGKAIYDEYLARDKEFITVAERRAIVNVVVEALIEKKGLFPTTQEKDMLAASFIEAFPCLGIREGNKLIHSHYYHAKTGGFIETALKALRKKQPECRKRKVNHQLHRIRRKIPRGVIEQDVPDLEEDEIHMHEFLVRLMKNMTPNETNAQQIIDAMDSTYAFRQYQMKKTLKTPTLILEEYPRMVDSHNGSLIFNDFMKKYPMAQGIENNFVDPYSDRLVRLAEKEREDELLPTCNDEFLRLLLFCLFTMPEIRKIRKISFEAKIEQLVVFFPENRDPHDFIKKRANAQKESGKHPFLLSSGKMSDPIKFYLIIENIVIPCGNDSLSAFKNLFASYFVFQLHFPVLIKPLFKFFEERIFRITPTMTATTADFVSRLESLPRENSN